MWKKDDEKIYLKVANTKIKLNQNDNKQSQQKFRSY